MEYIALIHTDEDPGFGLTFPDFPGCVTVGDTMDEVMKNAEEALLLHMEGMIADGEVIPLPRTLDEVVADPDFEGVPAIVRVEPPAKSERKNIVAKDIEWAQIDARAAAAGMSRSAYMVQASLAQKAMAEHLKKVL